MRLVEIVEASRDVAGTPARLAKLARLADCLRRLPVALAGTGAAYLAGELPQGRLGIGYAGLRAHFGEGAGAPDATLTLTEVDAAFTALKAEAGAGAGRRRRARAGGPPRPAPARARALPVRPGRATAGERDFLVRLIIGELRQGALESLVGEALARAHQVPSGRVRRALMLAGALPAVAQALAEEGPAGLDRFDLRLFRPVQP